jgi:hypothetical protein
MRGLGELSADVLDCSYKMLRQPSQNGYPAKADATAQYSSSNRTGFGLSPEIGMNLMSRIRSCRKRLIRFRLSGITHFNVKYSERTYLGQRTQKNVVVQ